MAETRTQHASGHIILVQEQRFRLFTESGQGLLLTLSHKAPLGGEDLQRLRREHNLVQVVYEGAPDLATGVALEVREAGPGVAR